MTCRRAEDGSRVLAGRHLDGCATDQCPGCLPCPDQHCPMCRREHDTGMCPMCLGLLRAQLHDLATLVTHLPEQAQQGRAAFVTHGDVPGGDALVLLAPGNVRTGHPDESKADPRPPLPTLSWWVGRLGDGVRPKTMAGVVAWLDQHLTELRHHRELSTLARDVAQLLRRTEDVLHDGVRPETSRVPCWECGTRLVKVYAAQVAADHWVCPRCGEVYDKGRFDRAKHDHLASEGAARFVHITDAAVAIGRPKATLKSWVRLGLLESALHPTTRRRMVWWPDVRELHLSTVRRNAVRPGEEADQRA